MTAKAYNRGHSIEFINGDWVYEDNHKPIDMNRPCKKCGEDPTKEGYDACLGHIDGVSSACCGHGVEESYMVKSETITENK